MSDPIRLYVNGTEHLLRLDPDAPLIYVLRNDLGLVGTRFGCGLGVCGACFVLVDGRAVPACDTPLWAAAGKRIVTVEGLARSGEMHAVQKAFIEEQAVQCGYCTSGLVISAAALLAENPKPSESEIRAALDRNLCRCGTHNRVVRAVQRAATEMSSCPGR